MILFLYGEDSYISRQKLNAIKKKYIDVNLGDINLTNLSAKDLSFDSFVRQVQAVPFLAKSRLVIIKNLLSKGGKNLQEKILEYLPKVPVSTNLIFYEDEKFDKRNTLYKKLTKKTSDIKSQEFKPLSDYELRDWIKKEIETRNATIEPQAIEKLIQCVGNDLWRLSNEIEKLIAYGLPVLSLSNGSFMVQGSMQNDTRYAISAKQVELLVRPKIIANVFDLVDALGNKNLVRAQEEKRKLLSSGEHKLYVLTMIVYQFRNLVIIKDLATGNKRHVTSQEIAKEAKLHPFVVQKTMAQCKNFTMPELKKIYQKLLGYDTKIKSGQIEAGLALDLLIVELCG